MLVQCLHNHCVSGRLEITIHHTTLMERSRVTPTLSTHSKLEHSLKISLIRQTLQSARQSVKYLRSSERWSEFSIFVMIPRSITQFSMLRMCPQLAVLKLKPLQRRMKYLEGFFFQLACEYSRLSFGCIGRLFFN